LCGQIELENIFMKINVGSKNKIKIAAVKEAISSYDFLSKAKITGIDTPSEVPDQPKSMEETIQGAMNRASNAFLNCHYRFGLESGLMEVPNTKTGYMDFCACVIYDGSNHHLGLSSAFEYPSQVTHLVFKEGMDINQAFYKTGLTKNPKVGSFEGAIGILTKGRLLRKDYTKQAITMALIHLENKKLF
jgi:inosine/xanthosine triphosphatase